MKGKALIIYSSITGNTDKVANWFRESFAHYCMEVTMVRVKNKMDWSQYAGKTYLLPPQTVVKYNCLMCVRNVRCAEWHKGQAEMIIFNV